MNGVLAVAYLSAGVLFIRSLAGLSKQETATSGNELGMVGMAVAVAVAMVTWIMGAHDPSAQALHLRATGLALLAGAIGIGFFIGATLAKRVEMTGMPELVAILHSFVGLAAVLVGFSSYLHPHGISTDPVAVVVHEVEVWVGVAVGAITFTGSIVAWGKLKGSISGKPLLLPGRHALNAVVALVIIGLAVPFVQGGAPNGIWFLVGMTVLASLLGVHLVMAIGGADMPVVVSLLNSYSGWAAAAAGFMLSNDLLIVTGALVGSSGTILSISMCRAMNRSILPGVFGGFGPGDAKPTGPAAAITGEVKELKADEVAEALSQARQVVIVPGYGMAVSRAQGAVNELTRTLREKGVTVRFAIHPVAGRLPGHMNVLLAEAGVPYDLVLEMEHINQDFPQTDVVLVIGANDIVNPSALDDPNSSIYGMPVLECWKARLTVVLKRGMAAGYAGIDNPLFTLEGTRMLFGDAKKSIDALVTAVRK
ncbi:MAG: NAD(P)(+) transhydrogenase (Re/Si-specific) subunit beta [Myxococcaceae bacterium]|nr:NAD(P)(+) transhydrogenase (Re/Si-specific) subunit beta [Myxococcaceae bacterium]